MTYSVMKGILGEKKWMSDIENENKSNCYCKGTIFISDF